MEKIKFFLTIGHSSTRIPIWLRKRINKEANLNEILEPRFFNWKNIPQIFFDLHQGVLNVNRQKNGIDPKTGKNYPKNRNVFPNEDFSGVPIYITGKGLTKKEKSFLLCNYYDKFFDKIDRNIKSGKYKFFIDIHLMNNYKSNYSEIVVRPDICIGNLGDINGEVCKNRPGVTISKDFLYKLKEKFEAKNYTCSLNRPFAGGYLMMKYLGNFPCLQLEINKRLLMSSDSGKIISKKAIKLSNDLSEIFLSL